LKVRHGRADCTQWYMTAIIYQESIDKKRKKCGMSIE
jgi:hypothetical protein